MKRLSLLSLLFLGSVLGEEVDTSKVYWLDEIVITAARVKREVKDISLAVSVITKDDIESSNVNSCTDILNTLPGVFVEKTGPFGRADVDIRGLGSRGRRVMVLVDSRPVKMGLFGCTITHSLPLDNVERIEVVRGPLSLLYGSDALGGVVNIITRRPKKGFETDLLSSYGSYNTQVYRLRNGGNFNRLSYYLTLDKRSTDGHLEHSSYNGKDFTTRIGYSILPGLELSLSGKYFDGYKEEPKRVKDTIPSDIWNDYKRGFLDLTLSGEPFFLKVYRNFGNHEFSDGWKSKDFTNGGIVHISLRPFRNNSLLGGLEFREQGGERLSQPQGEWEKKEYGVFLHNEYNLKRIIFSFGARYNRDEVSGSSLSPGAGLVLHLFEGTILRANINRGFRSPQLNELYMFPPSNPQLKPEIVTNYEAGLMQRVIDGLDIEITGYRMEGRDLIEIEKGKFENIGDFEFKGIEAGMRGEIKGFKVSLFYSYLNPQEKTKGRPGRKLDLLLNYRRGKLNLSSSLQWVGDYYAQDNHKQRISDYLVMDGKLSYSLPFGLKPFLAINNITDEDYEVYADLPSGRAGLYKMPKRSITLGMELRF